MVGAGHKTDAAKSPQLSIENSARVVKKLSRSKIRDEHRSCKALELRISDAAGRTVGFGAEGCG